ncbi:MAG: heparinase II/III family protein, partial [Actinomycetota bacterium]|nr:heparinase II/III family protein [Actinomycetota bacterium]
MSPREVAGRTRDHARRAAWRRLQVHVGEPDPNPPGAAPTALATTLPTGAALAVAEGARRELLDAADRLLLGSWEILGVTRLDLAAPDWFLDPVTGRRAPQDRYAFDVDHRAEDETGNVKQVWELSRHHHLTVLAAAWCLTGEDSYAEAVARQLHSWWRENPFLSGVHWTNGIEVGIRLLSWTWIRRLLDGWPGAAGLFEDNARAVSQIWCHQRYLAAFRSGGSSANNHVIAEAAGQLVAACAFPWFAESEHWRRGAAALLELELERNTFPSGLDREQASDYHGLVAELGLVAAVEAEASGHPLGDANWTRLRAMVDVAAAVVDEGLRPPRQGDGDDGRGLLLDAPHHNHWPSLLATGAALFGGLPWWPATPPGDVRSALLAAMAPGRRPSGGGRPASRPSHFADAGMTLLRAGTGSGTEIWCRCDAGPHGFLSIAAHAHADALSVEVRHGGVDVLADPGTYCYHGEPRWRAWF